MITHTLTTGEQCVNVTMTVNYRLLIKVKIWLSSSSLEGLKRGNLAINLSTLLKLYFSGSTMGS